MMMMTMMMMMMMMMMMIWQAIILGRCYAPFPKVIQVSNKVFPVPKNDIQDSLDYFHVPLWRIASPKKKNIKSLMKITQTRAVSWQHARLFIAARKISAVKMWSIVYIVFIVYCSSSSYHTITSAPNCHPNINLPPCYYPTIPSSSSITPCPPNHHPSTPTSTAHPLLSYHPIIILPFHNLPTLYSSSHPQFILSPLFSISLPNHHHHPTAPITLPPNHHHTISNPIKM